MSLVQSPAAGNMSIQSRSTGNFTKSARLLLLIGQDLGMEKLILPGLAPQAFELIRMKAVYWIQRNVGVQKLCVWKHKSVPRQNRMVLKTGGLWQKGGTSYRAELEFLGGCGP